MGEPNQNDQVSVDISMVNRRLASSIKEKLCQKSPYFSKNCIFKVPEKLRRNKNVFDPNIISIGPYHHGKPELAPMEKIKTWYLQHLLHRLEPPSDETLELFVENIRELQTSARECYAEPFALNDDNFIEMLVIDGCFLIELFRKDTWSTQPHQDDPVFNTSWMHENLYHDLILLENQIPWFVLLRLFQLSEATMPRTERERDNDVLAKLVLKFFETMMLMTEPAEYRTDRHEIKHILDLLRHCLLSISADKESQNTNFELFPPVTDLLRAGVKFKRGTPGDILNIKFSNGLFEIPPIRIRGNSESLFRNLIAYEQCDCHCTHQFTSYAVFLDCLINTSRDADLLCDERIVVHALSTEDISILFNRLYNDTLVTEFYYGGITRKVNKYYRSQWRRWRTTLKKRYFNNPWSTLSFIAAILILVFTFTQTLFSILSY